MREMAAEVKKNYQRAMEEEIERIEREQTQGGSVPTLLLHSCCGPCSTSVLEQLAEHFLVTVLYYNPNIFPEEEYRHRVQEQKRFTESFPTRYPISFLRGTLRAGEVLRARERAGAGSRRRRALPEVLYAAAYGDGVYGGGARVRLLYHHADRQPIKERESTERAGGSDRRAGAHHVVAV